MQYRGFFTRIFVERPIKYDESDTCAGGPSPKAAQDDRSRQHGDTVTVWKKLDGLFRGALLLIRVIAAAGSHL
jgi:hypothetical protein